jgi:hypothetical protein
VERLNKGFQLDGWSCGLRCIIQAEKAIRELVLGHPVMATASRLQPVLDRINKLAGVLQRRARQLNPQASEAPPPASQPAQAPPLPPPSQGPLQPSGAPIAADRNWGCSRCRGSQVGCITCNPSKQSAYWINRTAIER